MRGLFSVSARDPKQTSFYNALGDDQRAGVRGASLRLELETHDFDLPAVRNSSLCRTCFAYLDCVGIFLQKKPLGIYSDGAVLPLLASLNCFSFCTGKADIAQACRPVST